MWFAFGLLTIVISAYLAYHWRRENRWIGESALLDKQRYQFDIQKHKGRVRRLRIGILCQSGMHFCLKRENFIDRLFKSLGLSQEQQLNRLHFDERVYVVSDDRRLSRALALKSDLHSVLGRFFDGRSRFSFKINRLWCRDQRIWIEASPTSSTNECDPVPLAQHVVPVLAELAAALSSAAPGSSGDRDPFVVRALLISVISTALAINGGIQVFRIWLSKFPVVLDHGELLSTSVTVGGFATVGLIALCLAWLGRTSRSHLILVEALLIGGLGALASGYAAVRDINIDFDSAAAQVVQTKVDRRYTKGCGKRNRSTCYYVTIAASGALHRAETLQVSSAIYQQLPQNAPVQIGVHSGGLGFRWINEPRPGARIGAAVER